MLSATSERVPAHTAAAVNQRIQEEAERRVQECAAQPERISERLAELDREWDIERTLEANAATLALTGTVLGIARGKAWLLLPAVVTGFLLQHALQGWCPPMPVLRRLGFRTTAEIDEERTALKALRGDFADVARGSDRVQAAIRAARG